MAQKYVTMNKETLGFTQVNKFHAKSDLVVSSWYPLTPCESKYVIVGASPYKQFDIFVKLVSTNSKNSVYFTLQQWNQLIGMENKVMEFIYTESNALENIYIDGVITLTSYMIGDEKIIQLKSSNSQISLAASTVIKLFGVNPIIQCSIGVLLEKKLQSYVQNLVRNFETGGAQVWYNFNKSMTHRMLANEKDPFYIKLMYEIIEYFPGCIDNMFVEYNK